MDYILLIIIGVAGFVFGGKLAGSRFVLKKLGGQSEKHIALKQNRRKKENKKMILKFLQNNEQIANDEAENMLGVSNNTAERYLDELEKEGKIIQHGKTGRAVFYTLK